MCDAVVKEMVFHPDAFARRWGTTSKSTNELVLFPPLDAAHDETMKKAHLIGFVTYDDTSAPRGCSYTASPALQCLAMQLPTQDVPDGPTFEVFTMQFAARQLQVLHGHEHVCVMPLP
eukprot:PhM_4_TR17059/c1_g1_i4/m.90353